MGLPGGKRGTTMNDTSKTTRISITIVDGNLDPNDGTVYDHRKLADAFEAGLRAEIEKAFPGAEVTIRVMRDCTGDCPDASIIVTNEDGTEVEGDTNLLSVVGDRAFATIDWEACEAPKTPVYRVEFNDGGYSEVQKDPLISTTLADAEREAASDLREWIEAGSWGRGGFVVHARWILSETDDFSPSGRVSDGEVDVEIPVDPKVRD